MAGLLIVFLIDQLGAGKAYQAYITYTIFDYNY